MFYEGYHIGGMHLVWWIVWIILLFWIFAAPYPIPGQRKFRLNALEILQKRFAEGQINKEEFRASKKLLEQ
jgi:putative membrane protein